MFITTLIEQGVDVRLISPAKGGRMVNIDAVALKTRDETDFLSSAPLP
jgi:hypothetical protein